MTRLAWSPVDGARFATKAWGPRSRSRTQWSGLASGGAAPFTPLSLPSLAGWYKADTGLLDASDVAITVDGTAVKTWQDQSGNGRHLTQATAGSRPLYKAAILNALPVVRFDGTDDSLASASFAHAQQFSMCAVFKNTTGGLPQGVANVDNIGTLRLFQFRYNTATLEAIVFDTVPNAYTDTETATITQFNTCSLVRGAATVQTWVNGTSGGSTATANTPANGSTSLGVGYAFLNGGTPNSLLNGDVAELVYGLAAWNATDRQSAEAYLKAKWGTP